MRNYGRTRYLYWPVFFKWNWAWRSWFTSHGWQVGAGGLEYRIYGWTFSIGPLKICFGSQDTECITPRDLSEHSQFLQEHYKHMYEMRYPAGSEEVKK